MDSFELNKILGAILGTLLFVMGVGFLAEGIYSPITNNGPSYDLPEPAAGAAAGTTTAAAVPLADLLAKADPQAGAQSVKKCQSCHDFTEGGPNKTGPNLYDVVGRKIASHPGFSYSDVLMSHAKETWTYAELDKWLTSPKGLMPGTKMTFQGVDDPAERADILAYLRTLSHNPVAFPAAGAAPAAPAAAGATTPSPGTGTTGAAPNATTAPAAGTAQPAANAEPNPAPTPGPATGTPSPGSPPGSTDAGTPSPGPANGVNTTGAAPAPAPASTPGVAPPAGTAAPATTAPATSP